MASNLVIQVPDLSIQHFNQVKAENGEDEHLLAVIQLNPFELMSLGISRAHYEVLG
jgi:hypothetical protein